MSARNKKNARFPLKYVLALLAVAWIALSFRLQLPPASWFQESINDEQQLVDEEPGTAPFPDKPPFRFAGRSLAWVCSEYGLDEGSIKQELAGFAIKANPEWSIKRIAEENDMEREALFEVIRELSLNP